MRKSLLKGWSTKLKISLTAFLSILISVVTIIAPWHHQLVEAAAPSFIQESEVASWTTATSPKTTASMNVNGGDVLVALIGVENYNSSINPLSLAVSGGSLIWTTQQEVKVDQFGYVAIATATVDTTKSMTVQFTVSGNNDSLVWGYNVLTFRNSSGIGASNKTNVTGPAAPTLNLTTTQANSAIVVIDDDWTANDGATRTWRTNAGAFTEQTYFRNTSNYAVYAGYHADAGAVNTYAVGLTVPSNQKYSIAAVEVKGINNNSPAAPTLSTPSAGATGVSTTPQFQMRTTDADNDYLKYKIDVCSASDCSSIVRTIDQTSSQTGWTGQDAGPGGNTAYAGNSVIGSSTMASHTYQAAALNNNTQYWWRAYAIDPAGVNVFSSASGIQTFTTLVTNTAPSAPTLSFPLASGTGVPLRPRFDLRSTDADADYLKYKIELCSTSNCSSIVSTIDQTSSQTGWASQDAQSATAYKGAASIGVSTMASHFYQLSALTPNTQYWWRGYAIDPGGSNTFSSASSIATFTTGLTEVKIQGGTAIQGGTKIAN